MCYIDLEPCAVWREVDRKARKRHRCSCCSGPILPGQVYVSHFSVFEGDATSEKMCLSCKADRQEFGDAHESTPTPGFFYQMLGDCISENDPDDRRWNAMHERIRQSWAANKQSG